MTIKYSLPTEATTSKINVYNEVGEIVYSSEGSKTAGAHDFVWDGSTKSGAKASPGTYKVKIEAVDATQDPIETTSVVTGRVRGTEVQNGSVFLLVGERAVGLDSVINTNDTGVSGNNGMTTALSYVGLDVTYEDDEVQFNGSTAVNKNYSLDSDADRAKYFVRNSAGQIVYTGDAAVNKGSHTISWNGIRSDGTTAAAGQYTFEIQALDKNDKAVAAHMVNGGRVSGIETKNGQIHLVINNGKTVPLLDILSANVPASGNA